MKRWLVAYDVPDDRRRTRLANLLENYGDRVQYSVFEIFASSEELQRMIVRMKGEIEEDEDSVRLYPVCESCVKKVRILGTAEGREPWFDPDVYVL